MSLALNLTRATTRFQVHQKASSTRFNGGISTTGYTFSARSVRSAKRHVSDAPTTRITPYAALDTFARRHIGPKDDDVKEMLEAIGETNVQALISKIVPTDIALKRDLDISDGLGEEATLKRLKQIMSKNIINKSFIGMGYHDTLLPKVILRNVLENPAWYTPYTPYQAEISQGRLESLLNFQTMICDLTGMEIANASLLDEATAVAEAAMMCFNLTRQRKNYFIVSRDVHPQTLDVLRTRCSKVGVHIKVVDIEKLDLDEEISGRVCGALVQYPGTNGAIRDYSSLCDVIHKNTAGKVVFAADLLSLALVKSPGELGADIVVGSAQRFGVQMGYGGPHAAFFATKDSFKRAMPGRLIGVSKDANGKRALRMALQTREQHIRRDKATSNICTAQVLLANIAAMYAVYHGPQGLKDIAMKVHLQARTFATALEKLDFKIYANVFFDTLKIGVGDVDAVVESCTKQGCNIRVVDELNVSITFDEAKTREDCESLLRGFVESGVKGDLDIDIAQALKDAEKEVMSTDPKTFFPGVGRTSEFLTHPVFNSHHSETQMLRYIYNLQTKDLGLQNAMIPLGSCTMKLNATAEMIPVTWPEVGQLHPFVPSSQSEGYAIMLEELKRDLCEITGFADMSLQPNSGAQGEYTGLLCIAEYHKSRNEEHRDVCLIPVSAHGTNPASAQMAGMQVKTVQCVNGEIDIEDLRVKAKKHAANLGALMVTYPSTYGIFEQRIREICDIVHEHGGQVYLDGANLNAQLGLCRPGDYGADVCHLNLHKTFCIPHGGGGPGMGPIGVAQHLAEFLPRHCCDNEVGGDGGITAVSAAPYGSSSILPISWVFIKMMGPDGIRQAGQAAIISANYICKKLEEHYTVLYRGNGGYVAHEFIIDMKPFKRIGIEAEDVAKRLMDFNFHAPTMSFPVVNTLMIEPTESEPKSELDRFIEAMIVIRQEIKDIEDGHVEAKDSVLKHAPHTQEVVSATKWERKYPREKAAYPLPYLVNNKSWPTVSRIDNVYGDKNLICSCPPIEQYEE